jgi:DNA (cytosine-5)-methyltransferase 1
MKILNLYSGIGGNRKLWAGEHQVTSVEINQKIADVYRGLFPQDEVVVGDAHQYLLENFENFDFIWSSPPCQSHSKMMKATRHKVIKYPDMKLYEEIIFLKNFFKGKWIVENVKPYYEPLIKPTKTFGRHIIWNNFEVDDFEVPSISGFINKGTVKEANELKKWLGLEYEGNLYYEGNHCPGQILRNCVHPDLGAHILNSIKND